MVDYEIMSLLCNIIILIGFFWMTFVIGRLTERLSRLEFEHPPLPPKELPTTPAPIVVPTPAEPAFSLTEVLPVTIEHDFIVPTPIKKKLE